MNKLLEADQVAEHLEHQTAGKRWVLASTRLLQRRTPRFGSNDTAIHTSHHPYLHLYYYFNTLFFTPKQVMASCRKCATTRCMCHTHVALVDALGRHLGLLFIAGYAHGMHFGQ